MSWLKPRDWVPGLEYSSLFHSGLRAVSLRRTRARAQSAAPVPSPEKKLPRSNFMRRCTLTKSSPRPLASKGPSQSPPQAEKVVRPRPSSMIISSTKEPLNEFWITGGTFPDDVHDHQKFIEVGADDMLSFDVPNPIDPSPPAPRSQSFYVNLSGSSPLPPEDSSFLSLSNDSETFRRPSRRERPVSTQTMPPLSRLPPHYRRDRRERDYAWMLEESSPEMEAQDDGENADIAEINLDGVSDWRQFHVDWIQNDPSVLRWAE